MVRVINSQLKDEVKRDIEALVKLQTEMQAKVGLLDAVSIHLKLHQQNPLHSL